MGKNYDSFEDLWIWKEAMEICHEVYDCIKDCRDFKLRDQMRDCSVSMASNIAEGYELHTEPAFIRHLYISKGSGGELRTQLHIAIRQKYVASDRGNILIERTKRWAAGMHNFIAERKKSNRR
jgi:four helix bundle protein